jgi:hypothetical protein
MLRKQRGVVPYRVDTSAAPAAPRPTWRARVLNRESLAEALRLIFTIAIIVAGGFLFRAMAPVGESFANFIDRLAGVAH